MAKVYPLDDSTPKPGVAINIEPLPESKAPLDSETVGSGINSDFEQSFLHDDDTTSLNESAHLKDTVLLLTPTVMQPVPRKIAAAILISQRVKLQHTRKKLVELAKSNRKIIGGSSNRMGSMRFNMSSRTMNANKIVDLTITEETQLFPTAFPVFRNDIFAKYEANHIERMNRSRCKLSFIVLICAALLALECLYAIRQFSAATALAKQPPVSFHFLGWQLLWNTQPYEAFFDINFPIYWALPVLVFSIISAIHLSFRTFRCVTRHRDVGYGLCSRRTKIDVAFKLSRVVALATVIVAWYNGRGVSTPRVKDAFYEAQCALEALYGRQTEDYHIEGTSAGDCGLLITTTVMENERDYPGLIPDTTIGNEGGNATAFLVPLGKEIGCPLSSNIYDIPSDASGTHAEWEPFQYRPKRRCLSQKGYTMSNWITYATDCSSDAYLRWINSTEVTSFAHLEQWCVLVCPCLPFSKCVMHSYAHAGFAVALLQTALMEFLSVLILLDG